MELREKAFGKLVLPVGSLVNDGDNGDVWVFCGWAVTKESREAFFVREVTGRRLGPAITWSYKAVYLDTLLKKFPGLVDYVR